MDQGGLALCVGELNAIVHLGALLTAMRAIRLVEKGEKRGPMFRRNGEVLVINAAPKPILHILL